MRLVRILLRKVSWSNMMSEAEKLVGYSTSNLNAQHLLTDELDQLALSVRKLISSGHPLVKSAKQLYSGENFIRAFGLTVLLVSRAAVPSSVAMKSSNGAVLESQSSLAEITELVYTANFIHRGLMNSEDIPDRDVSKLTMGNKMAVLAGDLLLANSSVALAKLGHPNVVNDIAQGIADMTVSVFVDDHNAATPVEAWERRVYLGMGSLLAHACRSSVRLGGANGPLDDAAFEFAKQLSYLMALYNSRTAAVTDANENSDWAKSTPIFPIINLAADDAPRLASSYSQQALQYLHQFPSNKATGSLRNLTEALAESVKGA